MEKVLDLRGLSCPIPLIRTKDALTVCDSLTVLVDEMPAKENIIKYVMSQDWQTECINKGREFELKIRKINSL